jgi:hypothetical protein
VQKLFLFSLFVSLASCSVEPTVPNDGKFHPPTNGVAESESAACAAISTAIGNDRSNLQCVGTLPTCPDLVVGVSGQTCAQYDQGSIQGCVDYYSKGTTCADLNTRITNCVYAAIAGSAGKGCP